MRQALPLRGVRVLVTRAQEDAGSFGACLEARGARVLNLPSLSIEPPQDFGPLDAALDRLEAFDWLAFSSRHAVRAVFGRLATRDASIRLPARLQIAAVGPSTAAELRGYGATVSCVPTDARGEALARDMERYGVRDRDVFIPVGNRSRPELRRGLEDAGARVHQVVVYRTVSPAEVDRPGLDALLSGEIDVIALASPSALQNLLSMLEGDASRLAGVRLACIGPTTAQTVREYGLTPAIVADPHTLDGLVDAISHLCTMENLDE